MAEDTAASADLDSRGSTVDVSQIESRMREAIELGLNISELIGTGEKVISQLPDGLIHDLSIAIVDGKKPISHLLRQKLAKKKDELSHPEGGLAPSDAVEESHGAKQMAHHTSATTEKVSGLESSSIVHAQGPGIHEHECQHPSRMWTPNPSPLSTSQLRDESRPESMNAHSPGYHHTDAHSRRSLSRPIGGAEVRPSHASGQESVFEGKGTLRVRDGKVEVVEWKARSSKSRRHANSRNQSSKPTFHEPPFTSSNRRPPMQSTPMQALQSADLEERQEQSRDAGRPSATGHRISVYPGVQSKEETRKWRDHLKMRAAALEWLSGQQTIRLKLQKLLLKEETEPKVQTRLRPSTASRISPIERSSTESRLPSDRILQRLRRGDTRGDGTITFGALVRALNANRSNLAIIRPPPRTRRNNSKRISKGILFPTPAPDRLDRQTPGQALRGNPRPSGTDNLYTDSANPREFDLNNCGPGELAYHELDDVFSAMDIENTGRIGIDDFVKFVMHGFKAPERRVPRYGYDVMSRTQGGDSAARKPPTGRKSPYNTPVFEIDPAWERLLRQAYRRRVKRGNPGLEFQDFLTALDDIGLAPHSNDSKPDEGNAFRIADVQRVFQLSIHSRSQSRDVGAGAAALEAGEQEDAATWGPEHNPARVSGTPPSHVSSEQPRAVSDSPSVSDAKPARTRIDQLVPIPRAVQVGGGSGMQMRRGSHRLMQEEEERPEDSEEEDVSIDEGSWRSEDEKSSSDGRGGGVQLEVPTEDIGFQANSTQVNTTVSSAGSPYADASASGGMLSFKEFKACVKKLVLKAGGMRQALEPPVPPRARGTESTPCTSPGGTVLSVYDDDFDSQAWSPTSNRTNRTESNQRQRTEGSGSGSDWHARPYEMRASRTTRPASASAAQYLGPLERSITWGGHASIGGGGGGGGGGVPPGRIRPHSVTGARREERGAERMALAPNDDDDARRPSHSPGARVRMSQDDSVVGSGRPASMQEEEYGRHLPLPPRPAGPEGPGGGRGEGAGEGAREKRGQ